MSRIRLTAQQREERAISENSIERVINTTIQLLEGVRDREHREELRGINMLDWDELKPIVVRLWNEERNRIFLEQQQTAKKPD